MRQLTDRLVADYTDTHAEQDVRSAIGTARTRFDGHTVRDFVPILVERLARRLLDGQPSGPAEEFQDAAQESDVSHATGPAAESTAEQATNPAPEPTAAQASAPEDESDTTQATTPAAKSTAAAATGSAPKSAAAQATNPATEPTATQTTDPADESSTTRATDPAEPTAARAIGPAAELDVARATNQAPESTAVRATGVTPKSTAAQANGAQHESASEVDGTGIGDRLRSAAMDLLPPPWSGRKLIGPVAAAIVVVVVVALAFGTGGSHRSFTAATPSVTTLHGVVGSEKLAYFNDPKVVAALARHGLRVRVEPAGSRQIATSVDLNNYDFAFPSSTPAAERILRERNITARYTPFSSPMAIATFKPIVDLLTAAGVVHPGQVPTLDMKRYLDLVSSGTQWNQLPGNTTYQVPKNILVSTTDPRTSNSADMYLAIASYVANDDTIVRGTTAEENAVQKVSKLFVGQGYSDYSSKGPFDEYLSGGMGPTPMVLIYEAQYVEASVEGRITPDMELIYPSPTILSRHTLVPLDAGGDRLGKLLSTDTELQQLAAEHGFRTGDPSQFASVTSEYHVPVAPQVVDVVDTPTYDTLQHLLDGVARAYN